MQIKKRMVSAWVFFFVSSALFPFSKGGIKGTVVDQNNNPIEGVKITIVSIEYPSQKFNLKTNKKVSSLYLFLLLKTTTIILSSFSEVNVSAHGRGDRRVPFSTLLCGL